MSDKNLELTKISLTDRTEQMHVKIVIAVARRHQVSKVLVRGFLALAAVAQIDASMKKHRKAPSTEEK